MTPVVRVDVVVAGVPPVGSHVDPAGQFDLDPRHLARAYVHGPGNRLVLETTPDLELGLAHRQHHLEAPVRVEVVVLRHARHSRKARVREVAKAVGTPKIDPRRQLRARLGDVDLHHSGRHRPRIRVDANRFRLTPTPSDRIEGEAHPTIDRPLPIRSPTVAGVHDALTIRRP